MPDVSPVKMGLFGISREYNSGCATIASPVGVSLHSKGRRTLLQKEKGGWEGCSKQKVHGFYLTEFREKEESFFFLFGSANITGHERSPFWPPYYI